MTEEEKKAIEFCKKCIENGANIQLIDMTDGQLHCYSCSMDNIEILLNLIAKQDNRIKELEKFYNEEASRLEKEAEKKDEIIKEMAKAISKLYIDDTYSTEQIIEYFEKKERDRDVKK